MGSKITIHGLDVSMLTEEDAADKIIAEFEKTGLVFTENEKEVYNTDLKEIGYSLDRKDLIDKLAEVKAKREENRGLFAADEDFRPALKITRDSQLEGELFSSGKFTESEERSESVDAYIEYDKDKGEFVTVKEIQGDLIDAARLFDYIEEVLKQDFSQSLSADKLAVEVDDHIYRQTVGTDAASLEDQLQGLNSELQQYRDMSITYLFGDVDETIDSDRILSWLQVSDEGMNFDSEAVREFVSELAAQYNTIHVPRNFTTSTGKQIEISGNEYGFRIDTDAETQQLLSDLESGEPVTREPLYSVKGLQRSGRDDLAGSYIEVDLDAQHLWLYKNGSLITETDIVSGKPTEEQETLRGAWPIPYKASPFTLNSDIYGYEVKVDYWMPFVYGQGLHDADWQTEFGGELYKTRGSHGCINLSQEQAELIFNTIEGGYPIILY